VTVVLLGTALTLIFAMRPPYTFTMPSERTMNNKKMMLSSGGVPLTCGKLILMRPEKPAPLAELIAIAASVSTKSHELSSITSVNEPVASSRFVMVNGMGVGVGS